jgi:zinc transport system substrate-binding protein
VGCAEPSAPQDRPVVAVSVLPLSYFVEKIAGDLVRVEVMIPPGASPVTFEPSFAQLRAVAAASLYVKVGHPRFAFESARLEGLLADTQDLGVVDASAEIETHTGDPHVWVSPRHARRIAAHLESALEPLLPQHQAELRANLASLLGEIDALDVEIQDLLRGKRGARFVVYHPAWGYFAQEYGLEQVAIEHEGREPDARQLAELIRRAERDGVRVVFAQPQFDPASAELVAAEIGARVELLDPLAYDWAANLRHVALRIAEGATP